MLTASGAGDAILIAGAVFNNQAGAGALNLTGSGRFLVYSADWDNDTRGGIAGNNLYNRTFSGNPPGTISQSGNLFIYERQPVLTVTADDAMRIYGDANPAFAATITGLVNGDTAGYAYSGAPGFSTTTTATSNVGVYVGDIMADAGTLLSDVGYAFQFVAGDLTITKATLTVTADDLAREYGDMNPAFTGSISGFKNGEDSSALAAGPVFGSAATQSSDAGSYAITGSGAMATNYDFAYVDGTLTINKAILTVTPADQSRAEGQANPVFTGTITGFKLGENASVLTTQPLYATSANVLSPAGSYAITSSGAVATNYDFVFGTGTLTVTAGGGGGGGIPMIDVAPLFDEMQACGAGVGQLSEVLCQPVFPSSEPPLYRFGPGLPQGNASLVPSEEGARALLLQGGGSAGEAQVSLLR